MTGLTSTSQTDYKQSAQPVSIDTRQSHRFTKMIRAALFIVAGIYFLTYVIIALIRLRYPFQLEWIEGASLQQIRTILDGDKLYRPPTLEYVPLIYGPLYFYLSAAAAHWMGEGFAALRLISFFSSIGCLGLIAAFVKRETGCNYSSWLAAGMFVATYHYGGAWLDLAKVDSLFLLLLLATFYIIHYARHTSRYVAGAILLTLTCLTKQSGLPLCLPILACIAIKNIRGAMVWFICFLFFFTTSFFWLDSYYDHWFKFYFFDLPSQHNLFHSRRLGRFLLNDIVPLFPTLMISVYAIFQSIRHQKYTGIFFAVMTVSMLILSASASLNSGGYRNSLLPLWAIGAILLGLATHHIAGQAKKNQVKESWKHLAYYGLCGLQFMALLYNPLRYIPSSAHQQAGQQLLHFIQGLSGEILIPGHGYLTGSAEKKSSAHWTAWMELNGLYGGSVLKEGRELNSQLNQAITHQHFSAIILDHDLDLTRFLEPGVLEKNYREVPFPIASPQNFQPLTGYPTFPNKLLTPNTSPISSTTTDLVP